MIAITITECTVGLAPNVDGQPEGIIKSLIWILAGRTGNFVDQRLTAFLNHKRHRKRRDSSKKIFPGKITLALFLGFQTPPGFPKNCPGNIHRNKGVVHFPWGGKESLEKPVPVLVLVNSPD